MVPTEAFSASLDTLFVYHSAERLDAYPEALIRGVNRTDERVVLTTIDGKTYTYLLSCVDSVSNCPPDSLPRFLSFKFNNKYNDQLFTDVQADIFDDSRIVASVSAIGHWLTASFAHNSALWGDGAQYATLLDRAASWLQRRATYIFSLLTPYELTDDELSLPIRWKPSLPSADEVPCTSVSSREDTFAHTRFSVYSLQGICLKPSATFDTWLDGLPRGIYIVNGKRVLVK